LRVHVLRGARIRRAQMLRAHRSKLGVDLCAQLRANGREVLRGGREAVLDAEIILLVELRADLAQLSFGGGELTGLVFGRLASELLADRRKLGADRRRFVFGNVGEVLLRGGDG
jgi:hypothetical protein